MRWEEGLASLNRCGALLERLPEPSVARRHACQPPSWTAREMPSPLSDAGRTLRPTLRFSVSRSSVTPLGRPSTAQSEGSHASPFTSRFGRSTQQARSRPVSRSTRSRTMFSEPLAYPSTLDRLSGVLRGGALEPEPRTLAEKSQAKAHAYSPAQFPRHAPRVFLSQAGPRFDLELVQAEHHLWFRRWLIASENDEGDPVGSPSTGSLCG